MLVEESDKLFEKMIQVNSAFIKWNSQNIGSFYNVNGKKPEALTKTQQLFLSFIMALENATLSDIEEFTGISKSSISITISRMVEDGYVIRYKGENQDARKSFLKATPKGVKAMEDIKQKILFQFKTYYESISEGKRELLKAAIENSYLLMVDEEDRKK